jgi:hypothetical protein
MLVDVCIFIPVSYLKCNIIDLFLVFLMFNMSRFFFYKMSQVFKVNIWKYPSLKKQHYGNPMLQPSLSHDLLSCGAS